MRPAFRRGWEGEGKPNRRTGAGQRARSDRHTGAAILLWGTRGQSPWRSRLSKGTEEVSLPQPQRGTGNGTLARRDADGRYGGERSGNKAVAPTGQRRPLPRTRRRRPTGRTEARVLEGQLENIAPSRSAKRGKECDPRKSRSLSPAPDRHPKGQDYRLDSRSE